MLVQARCKLSYIRLILRRLCCAKDGTRAHCVPPFPKVGLSLKPYRSVRQPGYLPNEGPLGFAPPPHDGFAFLAALPEEDAPQRYFDNDCQLRSCQGLQTVTSEPCQRARLHESTLLQAAVTVSQCLRSPTLLLLC